MLTPSNFHSPPSRTSVQAAVLRSVLSACTARVTPVTCAALPVTCPVGFSTNFIFSSVANWLLHCACVGAWLCRKSCESRL
ncbi:MAG: hypothetical protein M3N10_00350 [Actinomycetota bacterium]|nr:hypothetical protein [Actinomycetota bacterium]